MVATTQKVKRRQRVGGGGSQAETWGKNTTVQAEGMPKYKQGAKVSLACFSNRKKASMAGANQTKGRTQGCIRDGINGQIWARKAIRRTLDFPVNDLGSFWEFGAEKGKIWIFICKGCLSGLRIDRREWGKIWKTILRGYWRGHLGKKYLGWVW